MNESSCSKEYNSVMWPNSSKHDCWTGISCWFAYITGECWAGYKDIHDYARHGKQDTDSCIGDDFQNCGNLSRYCVGRPRHSMVYKIGRWVYNLTLKMYQVAVELLEYINDKDLVNYINHDKFKHNKKNLSLRNRKKRLSKKTIWWLQDVGWGFEHIFVFFQLMQQVVLKPHSRKLNATKITMKSEKGHYQTTCLMILIPQLRHLAEYVLTGKTGIFISRCLPAGVLGKPRLATPLSLESNPTVGFHL